MNNSKLIRQRNVFGGPGLVLRNFKGSPVPGGSLDDGRVGGLKSSRKGGK
jgi:hypothetical protein